jgi:hypothetical protein
MIGAIFFMTMGAIIYAYSSYDNKKYYNEVSERLKK